MERASGAVAIPGNAVRLLYDGPDIFAAMHRLIAGATRRIHFENYLFRDDECGTGFAEALIARAREGVLVRVVHDWLGSMGTSRRFWERMRQVGIEVVGFNPPRLASPLGLISRDHRKTMVVDGRVAVTGGHCIGNEWAGDPSRGRQPWRDTAVELAGPAARALDGAFAKVWQAAGHPAPDDVVEVESDVAPAGEETVRVVATRPGEERVGRVMEMLLGIGAERIWVTEAYLAGPTRLFQIFQDAAADGVDVRLLVPGASDIPMVRNLSRAGYKRLLRSGVRLWEWGGPMLHAKTMAIDSRWVRVGSSNLNPSSLIANWEVDLFIESEELARGMDRKFVEDLARSSEVVTRPRRLPRLPVLGKPTALVATEPAVDDAVGHHRPAMLERRRRAYLRLASLTRAAHAALAGSAAVALLVFALLLVLFPRAAAYSAAALSVFVGSVLLAGMVARRRGG